MKKIVILISGRGSNLKAILETHQQKTWPAHVMQVIANRPDAPGIRIAQAFNIPVTILDHLSFPTREDFDKELLRTVKSFEPDLVVLAGFMRMLANDFVKTFSNRLINIHPSLLPSFPGLKTHAAALQKGVKWHGATVHFVTEEMDVGPIITQGIVQVLPDDTEETLAKRVFQIEHKIFPQAIEWFISDQLHIENGQVRVDCLQEPIFMLQNSSSGNE
jgi:phosphoribosylglycinamide formyltransferase-1